MWHEVVMYSDVTLCDHVQADKCLCLSAEAHMVVKGQHQLLRADDQCSVRGTGRE